MATNNNKRKILIFSTAYYPFVAGAEVAVKEITDRLGSPSTNSGQVDFQFDLITAKLKKGLPKIEKIGNVNIYRLGIGSPMFDKITLPFYGAIFAWRLNKRQNYFCFWTIMASFASGAGYICNIMRFISGKKRIPIVLSLQEGDSENYLKYKWAGLLALSWRLALWQADFLTALSNYLLNRAKRMGYKGDSALVPNGVDLDLFSQEISLDTKQDLKVKLGKKDGDIFLVTSSRLTYKNAVDDIISALVYLPANVTLVIIGKGHLGPSLQKQAHKLCLSDRVKFLGFLAHSDMPKYLSICDIFIRPSRSEGFGNSFIEAMAARLPVIATPVGGIPDFIDDKETGVFCSSDNPQSIAIAVRAILDDSTLRDRIVEKAYARVVERYGWDRISQEMKIVFDKMG